MDALDAFLLSCDSDSLSLESFGKFEQYLLKNVMIQFESIAIIDNYNNIIS